MEPFQFRHFSAHHRQSSFKIGTDSVLLGAWAHLDRAHSILDIGTGCGVLALLSAQRSDATVHAVELDLAAAEEAQLNFKSSPWADRLHLHRVAFQDFSQQQTPASFDHLVSNPPYFQDSTLNANERKSVARHNQRLTFADLIIGSKQLLTTDGSLHLILPAVEAKQFCSIAQLQGMHLNRLCEVYPKPSKPVRRWLMTYSNKVIEVNRSTLTHRNEDGSFSEDYLKLTEEIYPQRL